MDTNHPRVKERRVLIGMSQERLGELLGLTFQQVQKYERGANRIGASRLWDLSQVLCVSVAYFFEDMGADTAAHSPRLLDGGTPDIDRDEFHADPHVVMMARRIRPLDMQKRSVVLNVINALCGDQAAAE
jgi:transcriptional regulator with XRE-family HTH domain